ncbi:hypothetical protein VCUG_01615 [Vavraia culicis subsp. floridensis]|uniref:Uncharacterized protein n=1 Tax=Vavraia culicis (isolate floridensis) TaxID=948595 RepID=L2GUA3_VAVCU|nr:uncharacterized protein VCUG_01615 [Vavraia culicis subsp. floridensis]ELA46917.1 hypothetical protein VCUG_01615 [Vavraia culicis subsp. floridensis]
MPVVLRSHGEFAAPSKMRIVRAATRFCAVLSFYGWRGGIALLFMPNLNAGTDNRPGKKCKPCSLAQGQVINKRIAGKNKKLPITNFLPILFTTTHQLTPIRTNLDNP